ncbi:EndoU domain-containing protein [Streptomyces sp. NPDC051569]|uniref:EndoU domain-containing protein n=1 Tax=Streptomyces sp. NPDC051569 TaxID=3365661 RepID=UPI0037922BC5
MEGSHPNPSDVHEEWKGRNHTLDGHAPDSRTPNKNTFPNKEPWTDDDKLMHNVEDVAKNPDQPPVEQDDADGGTSWKVTGTRDGVTMEVIVEEDGRIRTAYPVAGEGVRHNDENGEPQPLDPRDEERRKEAEHDAEQAKQAEQEAEGRAREAAEEADEARRDGDEHAARDAERERQDAEREREEALVRKDRDAQEPAGGGGEPAGGEPAGGGGEPADA